MKHAFLMNDKDGESFPMGYDLNLNSTSPVPTDDAVFPPVPTISCSNTEGLLVKFAFVDTTVDEVEFVKKPLPFEANVTYCIAAIKEEPEALQNSVIGKLQLTSTPHPQIRPPLRKTQTCMTMVRMMRTSLRNLTESESDASDEEEDRKEEEDNARASSVRFRPTGRTLFFRVIFPS